MTTRQQRENTYIIQLSTLYRQQTEAEAIKQALLLAMQDVDGPEYIIESEYFCSNSSVPPTEVRLKEAMGGSDWNMTEENYPKQVS